MGATLLEALNKFSEHTRYPADFLGITEDLTEDIKLNIKKFYDFTKNEENQCKSGRTKKNALNKLIIQNFDFEQIWQQLELQNEDVMNQMVKDVSRSLASKKQLIFKSLCDELATVKDTDLNKGEAVKNVNSSEISSDDNQENSSDESTVNLESDDEHSENEAINRKNHLVKKASVVDDDFFKLHEMEDFLIKEENPKSSKGTQSDSDEEGSVDFFDNESEDEEEENEDEAKTARFKDYFVDKPEENQPKRKTNKLMQELDQEDDSDKNESEVEENLLDELKSTLELRQERLQRKIEDFEEQAISEKPWQLKGEITAESRPQNSLLEEIVEFDLTSRPAPIITEQTSLQLEDIIKQRIKNKTFDDVEKISKPVETPLEFKKKLVLDQEKSKESLANIYEKDYLEQQAALDKDKMDVEEAEPETHKEIKKLMKSLFTKLDALSNFHFTSTPAIPELKIVSNLPAVNMEEVAPVAASDAALLAPEEIKNKTKGDIIGKQERTSSDKKRERRKKKLKQKIHSQRKAKIEKSSKKNTIKL